MALHVSGDTGRVIVASAEQIQELLDEFGRLVQEAILIDGRQHVLNLSFSAYESKPGDPPPNNEIW